MMTTANTHTNKRFDMRSSNLKAELLRLPFIAERLAARHIFTQKLNIPLWRDGISSDSARHVRLIIDGTNPLSLALARQAALICHFPNFNEQTGAHRTIITLLTPTATSIHQLEAELHQIIKSHIFGNLADHCPLLISTFENGNIHTVTVSGEDSYLDIAIEILAADNLDIADLIRLLPDIDTAYITLMTHDARHTELESLFPSLRHHLLPTRLNYPSDCERYLAEVDFSRAMIVNKVYSISTGLQEINNYSSFDATDYNMSLQRLCEEITPSSAIAAWDSITGPDALEIMLSNLYCSDCIDTKIASAGLKTSDFQTEKRSLFSRVFSSPTIQSRNQRALEKNLVPLARTEHSRWTVEKLLLGYAPYTREELYLDEQLTGNALSASRRHKKKVEKHHIDICSYRDLMHLDPASLKYDCFLTLAIDRIISLQHSFNN